MKTDKDLSSQPQSSSDVMKSSSEIDSLHHIEGIANELYKIAQQAQGDPIALLHLLRTLEHLHRSIQVDYFQPALPDSRQALYALLRDIEENGGWPYIQRWKLQALFANLPNADLHQPEDLPQPLS